MQIKSIVGQRVFHENLGSGKIVSFDENYFDVTFGNITMTFVFPDALFRFLIFEDDILEKERIDMREKYIEMKNQEERMKSLSSRQVKVSSPRRIQLEYDGLLDIKREIVNRGGRLFNAIYVYNYYRKDTSVELMEKSDIDNRQKIYDLKNGKEYTFLLFARIINKVLQAELKDFEGNVFLTVVPASNSSNQNLLVNSVRILCNAETKIKYVDESHTLYRRYPVQPSHNYFGSRPTYALEFDSLGCNDMSHISEKDLVVILDDIMTTGNQLVACASRILQQGISAEQILFFPLARTVRKER